LRAGWRVAAGRPEAARHRPAPAAIWRDPLLLMLALAAAGTTAWFMFGGADVAGRVQVFWALQVPLDATLCLLALRVAPASGPPRRFWRTVSLCAGAFTIGDTAQTAVTFLRPGPGAMPGGLIQTACFLFGATAVTIVMLRYPTGTDSRRERLRGWLDTATVLVGGAVLAWCFAIDPAAAGKGDLLTALVLTAVVLVTLFAAVRMSLSASAPTTQLAAAPMILAIFLQEISLFIPPDLESDLPPSAFLLRLIPSFLVAAGPRIQELQARANPALLIRRRAKPYSALPYAAITTIFAALIFVLPGDVNSRLWGVVIGAVAGTALVVARQLVAFQDNAALIDRLDAALRELRHHEQQLRDQAEQDALTGLLNRAGLGERVTAALQAPEPSGSEQSGTALLLIDLDDFKTINDTLGHTVGDAVLVALAERLRAAVRPSDVVARLGGDEFAILLRGVSAMQAAIAARRILAGQAQPVAVAGQHLLVRLSIGGALAGPDDDLNSLLRNADIALYEAKDRGKGGYVQYAPDMGARLFETAELGARLREAIDGRQFVLEYQPIVELAGGRIVGAEALVRWRRPDGVVVPPGEFVAAAERTGLIVPLGNRVLREACRQAAEWLRRYGAAAPQTINVNVSGRQLQEANFVDDVAAALAEAELAPDRLTIEVTETAVLVDADAIGKLHDLRSLGVRLALDDFGTAASSLGLLLTCPVTSLKLDRSFVEAVTTVTRQAAVATAVIQIANALDLGAVAEGIETAEQAELLQRLGYRLGQGFHFFRPLPPAELPALWTATDHPAHLAAARR